MLSTSGYASIWCILLHQLQPRDTMAPITWGVQNALKNTGEQSRVILDLLFKKLCIMEAFMLYIHIFFFILTKKIIIVIVTTYYCNYISGQTMVTAGSIKINHYFHNILNFAKYPEGFHARSFYTVTSQHLVNKCG